jgi:hypothetical protein
MTSPEPEPDTKEIKLIKDVSMFIDYLKQKHDLKARLTVHIEPEQGWHLVREALAAWSDPKFGEDATVCTADYNDGKPYIDAAMFGGRFSFRWPVEIVKGPDGRFKIKTPSGVDIPMSLTMVS